MGQIKNIKLHIVTDIKASSLKDKSQNATFQRSSTPECGGGKETAQVLPFGAITQLLLHGCEMPWLLQDHHRVLTCSDSSVVCVMLHCFMPAHWWPCKVNRRMFVQEEAKLTDRQAGQQRTATDGQRTTDYQCRRQMIWHCNKLNLLNLMSITL